MKIKHKIGVLFFVISNAVCAEVTVSDISSETWVATKSTDKMTGKNGAGASIWSSTKVELPFPYQGLQSLMLNVGKNPSGEAYAIVGVVKGQFWCRNCDIRIKFDDGEVEMWSANSPSQMSKFLFFNSPEKFTKRLKKSRKVLIETPFLDFGSIPSEFKAEGLPLFE